MQQSKLYFVEMIPTWFVKAFLRDTSLYCDKTQKLQNGTEQCHLLWLFRGRFRRIGEFHNMTHLEIRY